ncbi:hypothetical protein [Arthrobacter sp. UYCu512]|uniref:hypothetical protein n=1 Tax=Arthrobacter sp. UYCu512 TaxID=3156338 RepID=UPI00339A7FA4
MAEIEKGSQVANRPKWAAGAGSNAWAIILGLVAVVLAGFLFWVTSHDEWFEGALPLQTTLNQIAGLVIASGLLSVGWELVGRRHFAAEILANAQLSAEVVDAGLLRLTDQYLDDIEWSELFDGVSKIDIAVAYGRTWRNTHSARLRAVARRPGTRIRVFLPDPDDDLTMRVLANRFDTTVEALQETVRESVRAFSDLKQEGGGDVEVYVRAGDAVFSCYRFDNRAVMTMYSHGRKRRTSVPTFVVRSGKLYQFVYDEFAAIEDQSRQMFPVPS